MRQQARFIESERRIGLALTQIPPIVEEKFAKARALDALEKLLGDYLVRIDVGLVEWRYQACVFVEGDHCALALGLWSLTLGLCSLI